MVVEFSERKRRMMRRERCEVDISTFESCSITV